ncbi:MAG: vitamin K epoxide reductase family protein [Actinomyces sp.]|uniref:vitamin K epoxide reductase family protein n=1 Tax=Actinomyces sp. TaxID=29317 RepID=UPI0026DAD27F|nr:vitamin K epoxide reductase family protein [Actinomyces sp.]MDO4242623.1 vitamin K epoxide reductase family protein [Actinomyces sp.]
MAHVPTEAEIDAMSDEELEAYLDGADPERLQPGLGGPSQDRDSDAHAWLRPGGVPRSYAWLLVVCSLLGIGASWELIRAQITLLREPLAELTCDVNPLVSCGDSLNVWQGNLLGVPNSFVGAMAFAVLLAVGLLLASGWSLPRWMWWGLSAGCLGGVVFVAWFLGQSLLVFDKLCPFCMVIWAVTIPVAATTWGQAAAGGHLGLPPAAARRLFAARWWLAGAMYLSVVVLVIVGFWDAWTVIL